MKKVLKWIGIVIVGLIGLLIVALVLVFVVSNSRMNKTYDVQSESVTLGGGHALAEPQPFLGFHREVVGKDLFTFGCPDLHDGAGK